MRLIQLLKGWPGKPSHPPLTDASIGAYTVGVAMLDRVVGAHVLERPHGHWPARPATSRVASTMFG